MLKIKKACDLFINYFESVVFVTLDSLYKLWTLFVHLSSADAILEIPENQWKTFLCADVVISNLFCDRAGYICSTSYHGDVSINRTTMHTENK